MKLGVVMGDVASMNPASDTTLGLLDAAQRRGWSLFHFTPADIWIKDGEVHGAAHALRLKDTRSRPEPGHAKIIPMASLDVILIRQNPPVDESYVGMCHMLDMVEGTLVINDPASICLANEKIFAQYFAAFQPPTLISASQDRIHEFIDGHGEAVVKPLNGLQGDSVFRVGVDDVNTDMIVEVVTDKGRRTIVVQKLIPEYARGDKRILLIEGKPVAHGLLRVPQPGKLRANMAAGGTPALIDINERDLSICSALAAKLRETGLLFVGIDVIGGYLTEVNVTSPTGMREIDDLSGSDIGMDVMHMIEARLGDGRVR